MSAKPTPKQRVTRILQKYEPSKVSAVDAMLERYAGREEELIQALTEKYGPEPQRPIAASPKKSSASPKRSKSSAGSGASVTTTTTSAPSPKKALPTTSSPSRESPPTKRTVSSSPKKATATPTAAKATTPSQKPKSAPSAESTGLPTTGTKVASKQPSKVIPSEAAPTAKSTAASPTKTTTIAPKTTTTTSKPAAPKKLPPPTSGSATATTSAQQQQPSSSTTTAETATGAPNKVKVPVKLPPVAKTTTAAVPQQQQQPPTTTTSTTTTPAIAAPSPQAAAPAQTQPQASTASSPNLRQVLVEFYSQWAPEKVKDVDVIIQQFQGDEPRLVNLIEERYACAGYFAKFNIPAATTNVAETTTSSVAQEKQQSTDDKVAASADDHRRHLMEFLRVYCPEKLNVADALLLNFKGKEEILFAELERKYTEPVASVAERHQAVASKEKHIESRSGELDQREKLLRQREASLLLRERLVDQANTEQQQQQERAEPRLKRETDMARFYGISPHYVHFLDALHQGKSETVTFDLLCTLFPDMVFHALTDEAQLRGFVARRLTQFYAFHAPEKIGNISAVLNKYAKYEPSAPLGDLLARYYQEEVTSCDAEQFFPSVSFEDRNLMTAIEEHCKQWGVEFALEFGDAATATPTTADSGEGKKAPTSDEQRPQSQQAPRIVAPSNLLRRSVPTNIKKYTSTHFAPHEAFTDSSTNTGDLTSTKTAETNTLDAAMVHKETMTDVLFPQMIPQGDQHHNSGEKSGSMFANLHPEYRAKQFGSMPQLKTLPRSDGIGNISIGKTISSSDLFDRPKVNPLLAERGATDCDLCRRYEAQLSAAAAKIHEMRLEAQGRKVSAVQHGDPLFSSSRADIFDAECDGTSSSFFAADESGNGNLMYPFTSQRRQQRLQAQEQKQQQNFRCDNCETKDEEIGKLRERLHAVRMQKGESWHTGLARSQQHDLSMTPLSTAAVQYRARHLPDRGDGGGGKNIYSDSIVTDVTDLL